MVIQENLLELDHGLGDGQVHMVKQTEGKTLFNLYWNVLKNVKP